MFALLWALLACTPVEVSSDPADVAEEDSASPAAPDAGAEEDTAGGDSGAAAAPEIDITALQAVLDVALPGAPRGVDGIALWVFDGDGERIISVTTGDFSGNQRVAVASASKLVTGLVLLRLVDEGLLSLEATTGDFLGWTGDRAEMTLDQLGAFTAGFDDDARCTRQTQVPLAACVEEIATQSVGDAPGELFDYNSTHMHVAARMAEVATGQSWETIFERTLRAPLGLTDPGLVYVTLPQLQTQAGVNPLIAGGLRATMEEYAAFLGLLYRSGRLEDGTVWIGADRVRRMEENRYVDAQVGNSPFANYGLAAVYGFGTWLECAEPAATCPIVSSPGAFGFTPWIDRDAGYYAILAMESDSAGGAEFSVNLARDLRPLIVAQLP